MKINTLFNKNKPIFSLEIFPPKKNSGVQSIYDTLDNLVKIQPDFISVTYGAGGGDAGQQTLDIAKYIKANLGVEPLAHMTCVNSSIAQAKQSIQNFADGNIENILALRGDIVGDNPFNDGLSHASDLVKLIKQQEPDLNVVGACYPESHYETKNLDEDIENLKYKIDNGVTHLITQLFFDNEKFYRFLDCLQKHHIDIPVEAGIMPITTTKQIERTVALSGASLPVDFTHMVSRYSTNSEALYHAGIAYAIEQIYELLNHGVNGIHVYTMNNANVATQVYQGIKGELGR